MRIQKGTKAQSVSMESELSAHYVFIKDFELWK